MVLEHKFTLFYDVGQALSNYLLAASVVHLDLMHFMTALYGREGNGAASDRSHRCVGG